MKTWILSVNRHGASIYLCRDNNDQISSIDLFNGKPPANRKTGELEPEFLVFLAKEMNRLCLECGKEDKIFLSAPTSILSRAIDGLGKAARCRLSGLIEMDLRSVPIPSLGRYTKEMIETVAS